MEAHRIGRRIVRSLIDTVRSRASIVESIRVLDRRGRQRLIFRVWDLGDIDLERHGDKEVSKDATRIVCSRRWPATSAAKLGHSSFYRKLLVGHPNATPSKYPCGPRRDWNNRLDFSVLSRSLADCHLLSTSRCVPDREPTTTSGVSPSPPNSPLSYDQRQRNMAPLVTKSRAAASAALLLSFAVAATAHEHHTDKIEEGHAISDDPIVRGAGEASERATNNANECSRTPFYGHIYSYRCWPGGSCSPQVWFWGWVPGLLCPAAH